jgi:hypothetical protein
MPSQRTIALIVLFWLLTAGYVGYRDVWPRLFASGPPPVAIDLADEASQTLPVRWSIYRGDRKVGRLSSYVRYVEADDTFRFTNEYRQLELDVTALVKCIIPELTSAIRITRSGDLREQTLDGKLEVQLPLFKLEATAKIRGVVTDGVLNADCDITSSFGDFKPTLEPIAIGAGQPLNPLQPVNRLLDLQPGRTWRVWLNSPLDDAIKSIGKKMGFNLPDKTDEPLLAQVQKERQELNWHGEATSCRVIEYKQQDEIVARTWVRVSDGKVLKQEAFRSGERLTIERDE